MTGPAGAALDAGDAFRKVDKPLLLIRSCSSPPCCFLWLLPLACAAISLQVTNAARYREELRRHEDRHRAMAVALRRAAAPVAASAATVCLGLLRLLAARMGFNFALGPIGAIGIIGGPAVVMTLLPALLVVLGRWVFWPRIPRFGDAPPARGGAWDRAGRRIAACPRLVWALGAAVLAALAAGCLGIHTGLDRAHFLTTTPSSVQGERLADAHFPGDESRPLQVVGGRPVDLRGIPGIARTGRPRRPPTAASPAPPSS
ncbi:MMPL family transporter [Spirillospora sp. NPDC046719]